MHRLAIIFLVVSFVLVGCASKTRLTRNPNIEHDARSAHAETDTNGDRYIDVEEYYHRITEVYFHGDRDKDGKMTYEEISAVVVYGDDWEGMDSNGDSKITLHEFVRNRLIIYEKADTNDDGLLSVSEVVTAVERGVK